MIAAGIIIKDDSEVEDLKRTLKSLEGQVDEIFITANGEETKKIELLCQVANCRYSYVKWSHSFAEARQFNFDQIHKAGHEWILWIDTDDELKGEKGALKKLVDEAGEADGYVVLYEYAKSEGYTSVTQWRERFVKWNPERMRWVGKVHEQIITEEPYRYLKTDAISIDHREKTDEEMTEALDRNLAILLIELEEQGDKPDPRTLIQLGRTLVGMKRYEEAVPYLTQYIPLSGWDEERYEAICMLGECAEGVDDFEQAVKFYHRALIELHDRYRGYEGLIRSYWNLRDWNKVVHWFEVMARVKEPSSFHFRNSLNTRLVIRSLYVQALFLTGRGPEAWRIWNKIKKEFPEHYVVKENDRMVEESYEEHLFIDGINKVANHLSRKKSPKLAEFFDLLPKDFKYHPNVINLKHHMLPPKKHDDKSVVIYCGGIGLEAWADPSGSKGIGGSEEAVIHMSRHWAKMGYEVTVYNLCGKLSGTYRGVNYLPFEAANINDEFNIFISWRDALPATQVKAKHKWVWLHDVPMKEHFIKEVVDKVDKIVVLSNYHRSLLPDVPDEKIYVSRNGIDVSQFNESPERDPNRVIYTSSPERGLNFLLEVLPKVRSQVPDVKFEAYYGWQNNDVARGGDPNYQKWKKETDDKIKGFGMPEYARLSHRQIAEKMLSSGIWFYPTDFPEISCITAMKAQASGAIPVCFDYAALDETVQHGFKIKGDPKKPEDLKKITTVLIESLKNPDKLEAMRQPMMEWARETYSWEKVAQEWAEKWK